MTENESLTIHNLWFAHDLGAQSSYYMIVHKHSIFNQSMKKIEVFLCLFYRCNLAKVPLKMILVHFIFYPHCSCSLFNIH